MNTNQVDFDVPQKFNLTYTDENGKDKTPLCIHRAPLGTHERFIGFLIEHFAGDFPLWIAPLQVIIIPVSDKYKKFGLDILKKIRENDIRVELDLRTEKVGAKIRNAEINKTPYMLIVGEKEEKNKTVSIRKRFAGDLGNKKIASFIDLINNEIKNKGVDNSR